MLGGEYSMTFHADGTMDFVMVGTSIPGLVWTQGVVQTDAGEAAAFLVDYYGNTLGSGVDRGRLRHELLRLHG